MSPVRLYIPHIQPCIQSISEITIEGKIHIAFTNRIRNIPHCDAESAVNAKLADNPTKLPIVYRGWNVDPALFVNMLFESCPNVLPFLVTVPSSFNETSSRTLSPALVFTVELFPA